ncbi:hypothetical protein AMS62_26755 [Bacillus sp. FJAT-18019]|nr:hypothetical protein AMS62_26755 [Bacillus sp. FJAT-18019]
MLDRKIFHRVITNHEIRNNPLFISNNKLLISLVSNRLYPIDTDLYCLNQFISKKKIKVSQLRNLMSDTILQTRIMEAVSWLIFKGEMTTGGLFKAAAILIQ